MKLSEFEAMYREDKAISSLVKVETNKGQNGIEHILYHILYKAYMDWYGRHVGLRVRVDKNKNVLDHDIFNMTLDSDGNWCEAVQQWFQTWTTTTDSTTVYHYGGTSTWTSV